MLKIIIPFLVGLVIGTVGSFGWGMYVQQVKTLNIYKQMIYPPALPADTSDFQEE